MQRSLFTAPAPPQLLPLLNEQQSSTSAAGAPLHAAPWWQPQWGPGTGSPGPPLAGHKRPREARSPELSQPGRQHEQPAESGPPGLPAAAEGAEAGEATEPLSCLSTGPHATLDDASSQPGASQPPQ